MYLKKEETEKMIERFLIKMSDEQKRELVKKFEERGGVLWRKGRYERIYVSPDLLGIKATYKQRRRMYIDVCDDFEAFGYDGYWGEVKEKVKQWRDDVTLAFMEQEENSIETDDITI